MRALWLTLALLLAPAAGAAEPLSAATQWVKPWFTRLDVRFPGQNFQARWDFHRCACGDVRIKAEETLPEGVSRGEMLLVDGRVLLVRGFEDRGDDLSAMVDSPLLMLQLLFVLLQKSAPDGPAAVTARRELGYAEDRFPLELETGTAQGGFPAPWEVSGIAYRVEDGSHRFDLDFAFELRVIGEPAGRSEIKLSGILDYRPREFPLPGDTPVGEWQLYPLRNEDAQSFRDDPPATLAEVRERIRQRQAPPQ